MGRLAWLLLNAGLLAQKADSLWTPRPTTALLLSLVMPGAGQIYNRAHWKAPIVWAAIGLPAYLTYQEHKTYLYYRKAYRESLDNPTNSSIFPENLRRLREYHRQNRDLFLLATLILYGLAAGEAYADAHLYGFRIEAHLAPHSFLVALSW